MILVPSSFDYRRRIVEALQTRGFEAVAEGRAAAFSITVRCTARDEPAAFDAARRVDPRVRRP